jgi:hypothetical protein
MMPNSHIFLLKRKLASCNILGLDQVSYFSTPRGIRIPVTSVKGKCPRPLDDGGSTIYIYYIIMPEVKCQGFYRINLYFL